MVLEYFQKKTKKAGHETAGAEVKSPVLKDSDEDFLRKLVPEEVEGKELVIFDNDGNAEAHSRSIGGADQVPLPTSPPVAEPSNPIDTTTAATSSATKAGKAKETDSKKLSKRNSYISYVQKHIPQLPFGKNRAKDQAATGADLADVANAVKAGESLAPEPTANKGEAEQETQDLTSVLDQLNLAAVGGKTFSISKETQRLMEEFTQILKDIVNGVPTAYDDLEKLLTNKDKQVRDLFENLPPFLQNLVKTLPTKMSASIIPGLAAAAAEKPGTGAAAAEASKSAGYASAARKIPLLKNLAKGDAIAGLLRGILNFLKLRFPAVLTGTNVLLSLAVFLLLFVFWYCHKRGRETRLEREARRAQGEEVDSSSDIEASTVLDSAAGSRVLPEKESDDAKVQAALSQPAPSSVPLPEEEKK